MSKILLINNGYPTKTYPERCSYIKSIKGGLEEAGHNVDLCVLDSNFKNKFEHIINYIKFFNHLRKIKYEVYDFILLNHYTHYAFILSRKLRRIERPVLHWHGSDLFPSSKILDKIFGFFYHRLPEQTKHITPSYYFKVELSKKYQISEENIDVSPSGGVDSFLFNPKPERKVTDSDIIKLGFASELMPEKGIELVIQLLNETDYIEKRIQKKLEVHYIYYGRNKTSYRKVLQKFQNAICWQTMAKHKMPEFYNSIDILLFPTLRKSESLGLVALESMSCECPVIGTDDFAIKEYVVSGCSGECFEPGNYVDFKSKVVYTITNLERYNPRKIIEERYSQNSIIDFYKKYFFA